MRLADDAASPVLAVVWGALYVLITISTVAPTLAQPIAGCAPRLMSNRGRSRQLTLQALKS